LYCPGAALYRLAVNTVDYLICIPSAADQK
jgi:hypothetical protein